MKTEIIAANEAARESTYCNHLIKEITDYDLRPQFTDNAGVIRTADRGFGRKTYQTSRFKFIGLNFRPTKL